MEVWQKIQIDKLSKKLAVNESNAQELLEKCNYNFSKALKMHAIQNNKYIESISLISKNGEERLNNFWVLICDLLDSKYKDGMWLTLEGLNSLPTPIKDILVVWQWYAFYDYEGISVEQNFTDEVIKVLESKLCLGKFAENLRQMKSLTKTFYSIHSYEVVSLERQLEIKSALVSSAEYQSYDSAITDNESLVVEKLNDFLSENIEGINQLVVKMSANMKSN